MERNGYDEIGIGDIIDVFKKRWSLIVLPSVLVAVVVFIAFSLLPRTYEAYALIKVGTVGGRPLENIETTSKIMKTQPILEVIAKNVGENKNASTKKKLASGIRYTDVGGLLEIRASAVSPEDAEQVVSTAVQVIQIRHKEILDKGKESLDNAVKYLGERTRAVNILSNFNDFMIQPTRIEIPTVSNIPVRSKRDIAALVAFVVLMMVNTMISFYLERKDKN